MRERRSNRFSDDRIYMHRDVIASQRNTGVWCSSIDLQFLASTKTLSPMTKRRSDHLAELLKHFSLGLSMIHTQSVSVDIYATNRSNGSVRYHEVHTFEVSRVARTAAEQDAEFLHTALRGLLTERLQYVRYGEWAWLRTQQDPLLAEMFLAAKSVGVE